MDDHLASTIYQSRKINILVLLIEYLLKIHKTLTADISIIFLLLGITKTMTGLGFIAGAFHLWIAISIAGWWRELNSALASLQNKSKLAFWRMNFICLEKQHLTKLSDHLALHYIFSCNKHLLNNYLT